MPILMSIEQLQHFNPILPQRRLCQCSDLKFGIIQNKSFEKLLKLGSVGWQICAWNVNCDILAKEKPSFNEYEGLFHIAGFHICHLYRRTVDES